MKTNQKGFAMWEILLLIVVLVLLGLAGWKVWDQNKPEKNSTSNTPTSDSSQKEKSKEPATEPEKQTTKYLEIPELGIKMQLDEATSDAYYAIIPDRSANVAYVSLLSLKDVDDCAADKTSLVAIGKFPKADVYGSDMTYEQYAQTGSGVVIGEYAYTLTPAQAYCTENPDARAKSETARNSFIKLAPTITLLQ